MKKLFLASTILAAALPFSAGAAQQGSVSPTILAQATQTGASWDEARPLSENDIDGLRGQSISNEEGEEIGEIDEIVRGEDDEPHAVISIERRMGLGEKIISVPLEQLRRSRDVLVVSPTTEEQLGSMPEYQKSQFRAWEQPGAGTGGPASGSGDGAGAPAARAVRAPVLAVAVMVAALAVEPVAAAPVAVAVAAVAVAADRPLAGGRRLAVAAASRTGKPTTFLSRQRTKGA